MKLYAIGDSFAYPTSIPVNKTWVNLLQLSNYKIFSNVIPGSSVSRFIRLSRKHFFNERFDAIIINAGFCDYSVKKVSFFEFMSQQSKENIKACRKANLKPELNHYLTYRFFNLCFRFYRKFESWKPVSSLSQFSDDFERLLKYAMENTDKVIIINNPGSTAEFNNRKTSELKLADSFEDFSKNYNLEIVRLAFKHKLHLIDLTAIDLVNIDYLPDGFHYGVKTHHHIFCEIEKLLQG